MLSGAVWSSTVGRSRLRTARSAAAMLPIDLRRVALCPTAGKLARLLHSRVLRSRVLGPVRPCGRCALRAAHGPALHPRAGGRWALPAWPVALGATAAPARPGGRV